MRTPFVAGNWKMNKTHPEALDFVTALAADVKAETAIDVVVCAPFTALPVLQSTLKETQIQLGAQNVYYEASGAYTGEISPPMLSACGCRWVIVGHSERREYFQENDVIVNLKTKAVLHHGLNPIICVGENLQERQTGNFEQKILTQVELALTGITMIPSYHERIVLAYEPIWAIGTGETCDDKEANRILGLIRKKLTQLYHEETAQRIRLLYGGSVKPQTMPSQIQQPEIDGGLVGGASLTPDSFNQLVQLCHSHGL